MAYGAGTDRQTYMHGSRNQGFLYRLTSLYIWTSQEKFRRRQELYQGSLLPFSSPTATSKSLPFVFCLLSLLFSLPATIYEYIPDGRSLWMNGGGQILRCTGTVLLLLLLLYVLDIQRIPFVQVQKEHSSCGCRSMCFSNKQARYIATELCILPPYHLD